MNALKVKSHKFSFVSCRLNFSHWFDHTIKIRVRDSWRYERNYDETSIWPGIASDVVSKISSFTKLLLLTSCDICCLNAKFSQFSEYSKSRWRGLVCKGRGLILISFSSLIVFLSNYYKYSRKAYYSYVWSYDKEDLFFELLWRHGVW
jgi:hypothetical protein